jgi:hypothetical protein
MATIRFLPPSSRRCRPLFTALGCTGYEEIKKEEQGVYEIGDAKCDMGTMDIKLDKDYTVILISRD